MVPIASCLDRAVDLALPGGPTEDDFLTLAWDAVGEALAPAGGW
jgi:hypothetical protein